MQTSIFMKFNKHKIIVKYNFVVSFQVLNFVPTSLQCV